MCSQLSGDISYRSGDRNRGGKKEMCSQTMETYMERQTQGQERKSSMQDQLEAHCGIQPVQVYGHTAQGASSVCHFHSRMVLRRKASATNCHPSRTSQRVDHNVDTRRRIRKVWGKKPPTLAKDPRRWNQATGPMSAPICSVFEAGWKPSTPGFWQAPDASATLDGSLFNKAQITDNFSRDMEMQTWKKRLGTRSVRAWRKVSIITDFAK